MRQYKNIYVLGMDRKPKTGQIPFTNVRESICGQPEGMHIIFKTLDQVITKIIK